MKTVYNGQTVDLITAEEISQAVDRIDADWPQGRFLELRRYIRDTLHDCHVLADHYEDAARQRAIDAAVPKHQQQFANAMQKMLCPGSVPETMPERARKAGL